MPLQDTNDMWISTDKYAQQGREMLSKQALKLMLSLFKQNNLEPK
jgi:hypothetical protein